MNQPLSVIPARAQRGAASLIVVMLLFFLMMLVTAYTSRSLIFEQRASANQYRSTQAAEAAEAGLQWALTLLDEGRIGTDCRPDASAGSLAFRQRYLSTDPDRGVLVPADPGVVVAACVRGAADWECQCPDVGTAPVLGSPSGVTGPAPAFGVALHEQGEPGLLKVSVRGCSAIDRRCAPGNTEVADAYAEHSILVALRGLANPPIAALTSGGNVNIPLVSPMRIVSSDPAGPGYTINAKGNFFPPRLDILVPPPGTPVLQTVIPDDDALNLAPERFFNAFFGMKRDTYEMLPTVEALSCTAGCGLAIASATAEGRHMFFFPNDLALSGDQTLGTPAEPVLIVVNGTTTFTGNVKVHGLLYTSYLVWNGGSGGSAFVNGATVVEGTCCSGNGGPSFIYDSAVLSQLKVSTGTFARVPGSWSDSF